MPWSDYGDAVRQLSGLVEWAAGQGLGAAQVQQVVALNAREAGIHYDFQTAQDIARVYGRFVGVNRGLREFSSAAGRLAATGLDAAITGDMIGFAPWSPSLPDYLATGRVAARVGYQMLTPEGTVEGWFTLDYRVTDLTTVGAVLQDAQDFLDTSGGQSPPLQAGLTGSVSLVAH